MALSSEEAKERLAKISTEYHIPDECDVSWLRLAACASVAQNAPKIQAFYRLADKWSGNGRKDAMACGAGGSDDACLAPLFARIHQICGEFFDASAVSAAR